MSVTNPVIVIGAGGHGSVVANALLRAGRQVLGFLDAEVQRHGTTVIGLPVLGSDDILNDFARDGVELANGIGFVGDGNHRARLHNRLTAEGWRFATVVDPSAVVGVEVELGAGCQIIAGAVVQPGARIGTDAIVNTRASVDHHCTIGDHSHIAPGVTLCGAVIIGPCCLIGAGAVVLPGLWVGAGTVVGAGCVVRRDVGENTVFVGSPENRV